MTGGDHKGSDPHSLYLKGGVDLLPWAHRIHPQSVPHAEVGPSQFDWEPNNTGRRYSSFQNDYREYWLVLAAGLWVCEVFFQGVDGGGITSVQLDEVEKGQVDTYRNPALNHISQVVNLGSFTLTKMYKLRLKTVGKNASSAGYMMQLNAIDLRRTS